MEFQLQHESFQRTPRTDFLQNGLAGSPCSPRDSQESSPTPQFKSIRSSVLSFLYSPTLTSIHDYWKKTIALTRQTFVGKVMSLLFNQLFRLVITFLPRTKGQKPLEQSNFKSLSQAISNLYSATCLQWNYGENIAFLTAQSSSVKQYKKYSGWDTCQD